MSNEFSTPKITPADNVKIPTVDGSNDTGYMLGGEVSQYIGSPLSGETDEYSTLESYAVGDTVIYGNSLYECTGATSGVWDSTKWKKITLKQLMTDLNSALSSITSLSTNKLSIADLASSLGQETNTAPTNKAVDDAITSLNTKGTYTPIVTSGASSSNMGTQSYWIVGNLCFVSINSDATFSGVNTNGFKISLPFESKGYAVGEVGYCGLFAMSSLTEIRDIHCVVGANSSDLAFEYINSGGSVTALKLYGNGAIRCSIVYPIA